jgi:hypothetical protein
MKINILKINILKITKLDMTELNKIYDMNVRRVLFDIINILLFTTKRSKRGFFILKYVIEHFKITSFIIKKCEYILVFC